MGNQSSSHTSCVKSAYLSPLATPGISTVRRKWLCLHTHTHPYPAQEGHTCLHRPLPTIWTTKSSDTFDSDKSSLCQSSGMSAATSRHARQTQGTALPCVNMGVCRHGREYECVCQCLHGRVCAQGFTDAARLRTAALLKVHAEA